MKKSLVFALVSAVLSAPVFAADSGVYIGLNYGQATASGNLVTGLSASHSDTSYGMYGGYQFNKNLAAELMIVDMGTLEQGLRKTDTNGGALSAVGRLPITEAFTAFAKLGYATTGVKVSAPMVSEVDTKSDITYGLGVQYNFIEAVGIRASYDSYKVGKETPNGSNGTYTVISAGVVYKF